MWIFFHVFVRRWTPLPTPPPSLSHSLYVFWLEHLVHLHFILDKYVCLAILFFFSVCFCSSPPPPFFFFSSLHFWFDSYLYCLDSLLFCMCMGIYIDLGILITMRLICSNLYMSVITLSWWPFTFEYTLTTLCFYSPVQTLNVFASSY